MPDLQVTRRSSPSQQSSFLCPHPEPPHHRVLRARQRAAEELEYIAQIRDEISLAPGTRPERRPEFWLDHMRVVTAWLLLALEDEDAARR